MLPTPSPFGVFGNWAVACDNGLRCTAVSLQPHDDEYKGIGLVVERDGGSNNRPSVRIGHIYDAHRGRAEIIVDGLVVASGELDANETMKVPDALTTSVLNALAQGHQLSVTGGDELSDTALDGASAVFRYMDAQQGRAGTVTAIIAKGMTSAAAVPTGSIPTIRAIRPPNGPQTITAALKADLWSRTRCDGPVDDAFVKPQALDADATLVLVSCGMDGGYNNLQAPYLVRHGRAAVAPFDAPVGMGERGSPPSITSGEWNPPTATLTSYERGRALGDCASQETFVWDGSRFRLIERDELHQCRGGQMLLPVWRARPVFTTPAPNIGGAPKHAFLSADSGSLGRYVSEQLHVAHHQTAAFDLNGDGRLEELIYADGPGDCGSGGCDLYVLAPEGRFWRVVSDISVTRLPVRVLRTSSNGWRDLVVFVAGGGILPGHFVRLRFDGRSYPGNPTVPPAEPWKGTDGAVLIGQHR